MEFIALKPRVTKDFILSKVNQESIMHYYTGLDVSSRKLMLSPFRSDNHITCSFYKSKSDILYLHDFATNEHINCFQVVMRLYNCNFYEALDIIAKDFGLVEGNHQISTFKIVPELKETESAKIQVQIKDYTNEELEWWNQFGISKKTLKKYFIYSLQHVFISGQLRFTSSKQCPIYGYYFGKDKNGEEKWKIYFPLKKEYRFLNNTSKKLLQGYHQLPKTGDLLVITKSMKDVCAMYELGIAACAPNSETLFINDKQLEEFKQRFKNILVFYDQDRSGRYNMSKIRKLHPELNYFIIPREYGSKDFTDLIRDHGIEKVKTLVSEFLTKFNFK